MFKVELVADEGLPPNIFQGCRIGMRIALIEWKFISRNSPEHSPAVAIFAARRLSESLSPSITKVSFTELGKAASNLIKIPSSRGSRAHTPEISGQFGIDGTVSSSKTDAPLRSFIDRKQKLNAPPRNRIAVHTPTPLPLPALLPENPKSTSARLILPKSLRPIPNQERIAMKSPIPACKIAPLSLTGTIFLQKRTQNTDTEDLNLLMKGIEAGLVNWSDIKVRPPVLQRLIERAQNS